MFNQSNGINMKVEELLVKQVLGILNEEEKQALQVWLDEDPANMAYFCKLQRRRNYRELYKDYCEKHPHTEAASHVINWKRWAARAAIWALPIIFAFSLWLGLRSPEQSNEILPGSPKATLYLENGAIVELGNSKELGWIRINDDLMAADANGKLQYKKNDKLHTSQQNTLVTPRGGEYRISLPDGTVIHLNSLSELTYPLVFDGDKREVTLTGEAYFEIAKDPKRPFYVKANGLTVRQYGTKFSVNARSLQCTTVALEEGSIGVYASNGEVQMMQPGELAEWDESAKSVTVTKTNIEPYTAWHRNRFVFEDESLGKIMETLSLWYNMDVRFQDEKLADLHFTGNISRYEDINVILRGVESTVNVQFQIKDRQIRIMRKE